MTTYTTQNMPEGYALVRYGFFSWGWAMLRENDFTKGFHSFSTFWTKSKAVENAKEHKNIMDEYAAIEWD